VRLIVTLLTALVLAVSPALAAGFPFADLDAVGKAGGQITNEFACAEGKSIIKLEVPGEEAYWVIAVGNNDRFAALEVQRERVLYMGRYIKAGNKLVVESSRPVTGADTPCDNVFPNQT